MTFQRKLLIYGTHIVVLATIFLPLISNAATGCSDGKCTFQMLVTQFIQLINGSILPFLFTLAFILFLYGVMMYIFKYDDSKRREEGIKMMTYGIIGLAIMLSIWGLLGILTNFIDPKLGTPIPQFK